MEIIIQGETNRTISCEAGQSVLDALHAAGIYVNAPCGGKGRCGKCGVRVTDGVWEPAAEDAAHFSTEELAEGWRLSCVGHPQTDCTIALPQSEETQFDVLADIGTSGQETDQADAQETNGAVCMFSAAKEDGVSAETAYDGAYFFAADIGTTTLAIGLVRMQDGHMQDVYTGINHQRAYGADVISRIKACDEGREAELTASIKADLLAGMQALLTKHGIDGTRIEKVVLAGNTTMGHLLLGYDCHGLGQMPFTPVNLETVTMPFGELFGEDFLNCQVTVMPGFSAYVGGDIVSGLLCTEFYEKEKPSLFIDLGTNGEMAVGNREKLLVTSTAAGPAFEGGNISCGVGSINGAVCKVQIDDGKPQVETIGGQPPIGICGTGVIETVAALLEAELLEDSGLLDEDYFDDGFVLAKTPDGADIALTQKDIRELQLAKAAVRAGLETLLVRYGIGYDDLEHVYVAGGFGVHLDMTRAAAIGLLPSEVVDKIVAAGNTALGGAVCYGTDARAQSYCEQMIACAEEVNLSTDKEFQEFYMDAMFFSEE